MSCAGFLVLYMEWFEDLALFSLTKNIQKLFGHGLPMQSYLNIRSFLTLTNIKVFFFYYHTTLNRILVTKMQNVFI